MNIAAALKGEIVRVSRKENRTENQQLKKAISQYRGEIASLKRRLVSLEKSVKQISKPRRKPAVAVDPELTAIRNRFSASGLSAKRKYLALSAIQMGALVGVSGQSIYKWEQEKASPRASQLPALRAAMKLGKREAMAKLATLDT